MGSRRREARGCGESPPGCVRPGPRALPSEAAAPTCQPLHQRMTHPSPWLVSLARSTSTSTLDGRPRAPSGLAGCLPLCGQSPRVWAQQARSFAGIRQLRKEQEPAARLPPWPVRVAVATRSPGTQSAALAPSVTSGGQSGGALRWAVRGCSGHFPTRLGQEVLVHKTRLRHDKLLDKRGFFFRSGRICLVPQLPAHHRHPWPPDRSRDSGHQSARLLGTVGPGPGRPRPRSSDMDTPPRGSCWTLTDVSAQRQNMEGGFVKRGPGEAERVQPSSGSVARVSLCYLGVASRHTELGVKWT